MGTETSGGIGGEWLTEEELAALRTPPPAPTVEQGMLDTFRTHADAVAKELCALALGAANERVRLDASKYITDRLLGRVGEAKELDKTGAPWDEVYSAIVREPTAEERSRGASIR